MAFLYPILIQSRNKTRNTRIANGFPVVCRPGGVIPEADTKTLPRRSQDVWVLASDGVWDVLAPEDVAKLVAAFGHDPDLVAEKRNGSFVRMGRVGCRSGVSTTRVSYVSL